MHKENRIESLKFELSLSAALLDKESQESVDNFNNLLKLYRELTYPKIRDRRFEQSASEMVKNITKLKFTPIAKKDLKDF